MSGPVMGYTEIKISAAGEPEVRYTSGQAVYVEAGSGGRWSGRYWSADGRINLPYEGWTDGDAFRLTVDCQPLSGGWRWLAGTELPASERGARHVVVELRNAARSIGVKIHTLLDGTPVLTRWLEITNGSRGSLALGFVAPWAGRLCAGQNFILGYFAEDVSTAIFIRPLLPTCRVYHHEPVNWHGGMESSPWFAMEYAAPERTQGWTLVVRMRNGPGDPYVFRYFNQVTDDSTGRAQPYECDVYQLKPRGLDPARRYSVTLDSLGSTIEIEGRRLMQDGWQIRLENAGMSELLLFKTVD